eukprot:6487966-Amphidinium_carterae.4
MFSRFKTATRDGFEINADGHALQALPPLELESGDENVEVFWRSNLKLPSAVSVSEKCNLGNRSPRNNIAHDGDDD